MSLVAAGEKRHPVVSRGIEFLERVRRSDGSWAIDSNLATWVTTLSVNALGDDLESVARGNIVEWLLGQQGASTHPYTLAAPGAWAWTDLPGGVPDADDTAGAILALHNLAPESASVRDSASRGIVWLADLQNRDGGIPTFCRGWGKLPFDRSSPDLTAHTIAAWRSWLARLAPPLRSRISTSLARAGSYLERVQSADGSWTPLWFGNQFHGNDENPVYGTSRVLIGLTDGDCTVVKRGLSWLVDAQNDDGGWGGARGIQSTIEETSVALHACASHPALTHSSVIERASQWLINETKRGTCTPASPIGFYFARLWYYEDLYPLTLPQPHCGWYVTAQMPLKPLDARSLAKRIEVTLRSHVNGPVHYRWCGENRTVELVSGEHVQLLTSFDNNHHTIGGCDVDLIVPCDRRGVVIAR